MRAQLFYEATGRLSANLLTAKDTDLWNTGIGEGSAEEQANDLLISIRIAAPADTSVGPIQLAVTGSRGRQVMRLTIASALTTRDGSVWKSVLLYDIGCDDPLTITASVDRSRLTKSLKFACGE